MFQSRSEKHHRCKCRAQAEMEAQLSAAQRAVQRQEKVHTWSSCAGNFKVQEPKSWENTSAVRQWMAKENRDAKHTLGHKEPTKQGHKWHEYSKQTRASDQKLAQAMLSVNTSPPEENCLCCERRLNTHTRGAWGWICDEMLRYIRVLLYLQSVTLHVSSEKRMEIMTWLRSTCSLTVRGALLAGRSSVSMMKSRLWGDHWFCIVVEGDVTSSTVPPAESWGISFISPPSASFATVCFKYA